MRRLLLSIAALLAVLAVPAGAGAYTLGVSDQQASTFTDPNFAALKFKAARYITPYDVMDDPASKAQLDAWVSAARGAHQRILISFEHSHRSNSRALTAPSRVSRRRSAASAPGRSSPRSTTAPRARCSRARSTGSSAWTSSTSRTS